MFEKLFNKPKPAEAEKKERPPISPDVYREGEASKTLEILETAEKNDGLDLEKIKDYLNKNKGTPEEERMRELLKELNEVKKKKSKIEDEIGDKVNEENVSSSENQEKNLELSPTLSSLQALYQEKMGQELPSFKDMNFTSQSSKDEIAENLKAFSKEIPPAKAKSDEETAILISFQAALGQMNGLLKGSVRPENFNQDIIAESYKKIIKEESDTISVGNVGGFPQNNPNQSGGQNYIN